jgi:serine/threonine-protein kinase
LETIGRYQILAKLGHGGMGVVHKAYDPILQRTVAVKTIASEVELTPELRSRFFREARSAAQLSHRNIITIHDLGEENGQLFLAMEYLDGQDLRSRTLNGPPMRLERKLDIMIEICQGVGHAHKKNVIHRDIKPANIFITGTGEVKILDFGLARMVSSELTRSNLTIGTPAYMSPEQVRGEAVDHRSDIFSTGVVFYELLTAKAPFGGESYGAILFKILQTDPERIDRLEASVPQPVCEVVTRALAKDLADRYQDMDEMLRDLVVCQQLLRAGSLAMPHDEGLLLPADAPTMLSTPVKTPMPAGTPAHGRTPMPSGPQMPSPSPVPTPVPPARSRSPLWLGMGGGLLAVAIAAVVMLLMRGTPPPEPAQPPTQVEQAAPPPPAPGPAVPAPPATAQAQPEPQPAAPPEKPPERPAPDPSADTARRSAESARGDVRAARTRADEASAATLAPATYKSALQAEAEGERLVRSRQFARAVTRLLEARGLFRSAEIEARAQAQAQAAQAKADEDRRQRGELNDQVESARQAFDRERGAAEQAGAEAAVGDRFRQAVARGTAAQQLWDRGDLAGARAAFEEATRAMRDARSAAVPAQPTAPPVASRVPESPETTAKSPTRPAPPSPEAMRQETAALLGRYESALESRSIGALKAIWPGLGGRQEAAIQAEFRNARSIQVDLEGTQIQIGGAGAATAVARREYLVVTTDGQQLRTTTRTTFTFKRNGGSWIIENVRFEPI